MMILLNASAQWEWTSNLPSEIVSTHEFFLSVKAPVNTGSVRLVSKKLKPRTFETLIKDTGVVEFPDPFSYGNDGSVHGYDNLEVYFEDELVLERQVYIYPSTLSIAGLYDNTGTYVTAAVASSIFYMTVLNNDSTILPNTTLILAPFASNCSSVISAKSTMDILSNSSYIAIHGPDCSESAAVDAVIAGAFEIPMISGTASASKLSNKRAYPYFMRTTPTSTLHAIALLNTVNFFKFKHIIAISTDQFPFSDDFYTLANRLNITIVANIILKTGEMDFSHQLDIISKTGVNVIISNVMDVAGRFDAKVLYEYGIKKGLFNEPYNWFLEFTPMLDFDYYVPKEYSQAVFYSMSSSMYLNMNRTDIAQHITDTWNSFNGDISTIPYVNFDVGPNDIKDFWEKVHNKQIKMRQVHSFQVDCLSTIARALHDILYIKKIPLDGKTLYSAMRNQSFEGLTGKLIFDQNGDTQPPFYINVYNNVFDEYAGEVTWDPVSHIGNLSLSKIINRQYHTNA
ncbi:hypothetical protein HK099_003595 [Clydaea vesicula]|uniref:Receptor ligand binding region domain-containing protein n=1 Tax=Clydaea vesicula TaxID=447962 RepID=A0AAD5U615_9FUNG|nr:hypothetical protein HK099_003595 [Clydaea vesicula]